MCITVFFYPLVHRRFACMGVQTVIEVVVFSSIFSTLTLWGRSYFIT